MNVILVIVLFTFALIAGALFGYAVGLRHQLIAEKDLEIERLNHDLKKSERRAELLSEDVALLEGNVDSAQSEARAHERTISMLLEEVTRADDASA